MIIGKKWCYVKEWGLLQVEFKIILEHIVQIFLRYSGRCVFKKEARDVGESSDISGAGNSRKGYVPKLTRRVWKKVGSEACCLEHQYFKGKHTKSTRNKR